MTDVPAPARALCSRCQIAIEWCAVCEREDCRERLCYRCVRIAFRQEVRQPHGHGG